MDEPLSNLDAKLRVHMRAEISALHKRVGVTTVYVTHDQVEAMTMADRVVIMRGGDIQQIADPDTLFQKPDNLFVAGFIGSPGMNFLQGNIVKGPDANFVSIIGAEAPIGHLNTKGISDVIVGLRPEHIELGEGKVSFKVKTTLIESLGSEKYVYFNGGEQQVSRGAETDEDNSKGLIARINHSGKMNAGEEITLSFDPENLYLFDAVTEEAIR